jgi:ABC-type phosphate/phosphonate transport system substrate-binding protein
MRIRTVLGVCLCLVLVAVPVLAGDQITLAVMASDDANKETARYEILRRYLKIGNTSLDSIKIEVANDYPTAVELFRSGKVDGMFAGSFVAATLIAKGVATPVVRPLLADGASTYRALVVARKGTKPFQGIADFKGKKVSYTLLASAGEVYVRSLLPPSMKLESMFTAVPAASHSAALQAVEKGEADFAVVKDLAFDPAKFPTLEAVGKDSASNPNMTLILTPKAMERIGKDLKSNLLEVAKDQSGAGADVRKAFNCQGFIPTVPDDFVHTYNLIKEARIDPRTFEWKF